MTFEIELKIRFNGDYVFNREKGIITIENDKIIGNIGNDLILYLIDEKYERMALNAINKLCESIVSSSNNNSIGLDFIILSAS